LSEWFLFLIFYCSIYVVFFCNRHYTNLRWWWWWWW